MFSFKQLKKFLLYAKEIAPIVALRDVSIQNEIILRHDIDISLKSAFEVAKLEEKLGITSSFFVMLTNPLYNIFTKKNRNLLREIDKRGFEVGLHFDIQAYDGSSNFENYVDKEIQILSEVIGTEVYSISLHNPIKGFNLELKKYNNAHSAIFSDLNYMSDSRMEFRKKDPYEFIKKASFMSVQVLLHPAHWIGKNRYYTEIFHSSVQDLINDIDAFFKVNSKYRQHIKDSTLRKKINELEIKLCTEKKV